MRYIGVIVALNCGILKEIRLLDDEESVNLKEGAT